MTCPHCSKRSSPQHRRMFAIFNAAYNQWPDRRRVKFQPTCVDELRAWLLCSAKYIATEELLDEWHPSAKAAVSRRFKEERPHTWNKRLDDRELLIGPLSMRFEKLPHKTACELFHAIEEIICTIIGCQSCDQLLEEHQKAA